VEREWHGSAVVADLTRRLERECLARDLGMLIVSATSRRHRLYRHFGFEAFGPIAGRERVWFQPMRLGRQRFDELMPTAAWRRLR
jgi:hypothetical protein